MSFYLIWLYVTLLSVYLSDSMFICLSVRPSVYPTICIRTVLLYVFYSYCFCGLYKILVTSPSKIPKRIICVLKLHLRNILKCIINNEYYCITFFLLVFLRQLLKQMKSSNILLIRLELSHPRALLSSAWIPALYGVCIRELMSTFQGSVCIINLQQTIFLMMMPQKYCNSCCCRGRMVYGGGGGGAFGF